MRSRHGHVLIRLLLVILLIVAGVLFFRFALRDTIRPKNFGVVEAGEIYRAGRLTPAAIQWIHDEHHIKTIIDLGGYEDGSQEARMEAETTKALGVRLVNFRLNGDGTGDPHHYIDALKILADPASRPVLVHCSAGSQRTGACVMLYRKVFQGVPLEESIHEAERYGHDRRENPKLMPYVEKHLAEIEAAVKPAELHAASPK